jgi:transcriptional regulator with XRE-family HTH domain
MDGLRLGSVVRTVRIRKGLRQADVAAGAHVSIATVSRIERGNLESASVGVVVRIAAVLEIRLDWMPRWRGGELDRMLNTGHAAMHEAAARDLAGSAWLTAAETTFAIYGERGIIDILAFHPDRRALLVIELKTDIVDVQGLIGAVDRYRRLAPRIARERGWISTSVSCWVLLRDSPSNHRRLAAHATVLRNAFPADGRRMRSWLRSPDAPIAALSFLSDSHARRASGTISGTQRVRGPWPSVDRSGHTGEFSRGENPTRIPRPNR